MTERSMLEGADSGGPRQRFRHRKRGHIYQVISTGILERTMEPVVIYQSEDDGRIWVRPVGEFTDGRFEPIK